MKPSLRRFLLFSLVFLPAAMIAFAGCDDLEEGELPSLSLDEGEGDEWDYPYYLIIGGALSETLSVLTIKGPEEFSLANDVQLTGSAINETVLFQDGFYAVCSLSNSVVVYDAGDLSIEKELSVGTGNNPMNIAFDSEGRAYLSNYLTNSVTHYDLSGSSGKLLATIEMPDSSLLPKDDGVDELWARPGGMALVGQVLFVALSNLTATHISGGPGLIAAIDTTAGEIDSIIELEGRDAISVLADEARGILYTVSAGTYSPGEGFAGNGIVEIVDVATRDVVDHVAVGGAPFEMAVAPNGIAYLGNGREGKVLSFDTETLEILDPIDIRSSDDNLGLSFASALAVDGNGLLYAAEFNHDKLFVIDTKDDNRIVATFTVNDGPDTLGLIR